MESEERERFRRLVGSGLPVSPAGCFMTPIIHCWAVHFAAVRFALCTDAKYFSDEHE